MKYDFKSIPPLELPQNAFKVPLYGGPSLIPREINTIIGAGITGGDEKQEQKQKVLPKPSLLFILTGLGRYSFYKLPFLKKHTFCAGLPSVLMFHIRRFLHYQKGSCKCIKASCKFISVFGLCVGLCKEAKKTRKDKTG